MSAETYQIKEKAHYLRLLLLKDDLTYFHGVPGESSRNSTFPRPVLIAEHRYCGNLLQNQIDRSKPHE